MCRRDFCQPHVHSDQVGAQHPHRLRDFRPGAAINIWLVIAALVLTQGASPVQAQETAGKSGPGIAQPISPGTISRLLLIAAASAGKRVIAVGEHGYVVYSDDQGKTWLRGKTPRRAMLTAVTFVDPTHGWAVGHDGQILASDDGGATWTEQRYKPDDRQPLFAVRFKDLQHGFALGAYGLFVETADGGKTWTPRSIMQEDKHLYAVASDGAERMAIAAEAGTLLTSPDRGRTWEPAVSPYKGSFFGLVTTVDGALLAFGLRGNIFRSADFGKTWTPAASAGTATLQGGASLADGEIVLAGGAGTVLSSRDNGASFQRVPGQKAITYSAVLATPTGALLFGEAGVVPYAPAAVTTTSVPATGAPAKGAP